MKKFLVHPGNIWSVNDGNKHYITFGMLTNLYKVNPQECIDGSNAMLYKSIKPEEKLTHLYPRKDGNYSQFWLK